MPQSLSKINNSLYLSVMTLATLSKLTDADILGRMSKEEVHCFPSWSFKWLHHFCNTLKVLCPACKFLFIFPWAFLEAQTEQFGRDRSELRISVTPFLLSTKREEEKMKEKNKTDFYTEDELLATQICKGMLNTRGFQTANQQSIAKPAVLGNGKYIFTSWRGYFWALG